MISKSKLSAIALVAAIGFAGFAGFASPASAASVYSPRETGGGSWGYNNRMATDQWRLKHHLKRHHHLTSKVQ